MTVLALLLLRIDWRLTHRPPPWLPGMAAWHPGVRQPGLARMGLGRQ